jgi:8-oxo-dGTP pyrophosphatase MutT (NUDIX family)
VEADRPASGEELNPGRPTEPRQAATVILLRGGRATLEVLLVRRNPAARFMGGAWVFPGGAVDASEDHETAGVREVAEESGVALADPRALVRFSRWITPAAVQIRFDTHFFLAEAPPGAEARCDGQECVDVAWYTPQDALAAYARGDILLVFPTIKTLEQLAAFESAQDALRTAAARPVAPVEPRVRTDGDRPRIVLPGEPGYEDED